MNKCKFNIYLAGPMSGVSWEEQNQWRKHIKNYIEHYASIPVHCINPCSFYNLKDRLHNTELEVLDWDLSMVKGSDLVICMLSNTSVGSIMEIAVARENGIPILGLYLNEDTKLHPWIENSVSRLFTDVNDLLEYVMYFYLWG